MIVKSVIVEDEDFNQTEYNNCEFIIYDGKAKIGKLAESWIRYIRTSYDYNDHHLTVFVHTPHTNEDKQILFPEAWYIKFV